MKNRMKTYKVVLFVFVIAAMQSCSTLSVTKGRMLKTPLDYKYSDFEAVRKQGEYRIAVDDAIVVNMFANEGYNFVMLSGGQGAGSGAARGVLNQYKVRADSTIKVPIVGKLKVVGYTLEELETIFEKLLGKQYQSPFVTIEIQNRRIFVFSGISKATTFLLNNQNTTLFEVLAGSGGIPTNSNASKIKIIRGDLRDPKIYLIDLSTIEGMKDANLTMQAGDIVYIEPFINYASIITSDVTNLLSVLTTGVLVYTLFR